MCNENYLENCSGGVERGSLAYRPARYDSENDASSSVPCGPSTVVTAASPRAWKPRSGPTPRRRPAHFRRALRGCACATASVSAPSGDVIATTPPTFLPLCPAAVQAEPCRRPSPTVSAAAKMATGAPAGSSTASGSNRRLQQTQNQVDEVVDIMRVNVDKVLERDQKLSELDDRADALQAGASQFETSAAKLKRKYWWKNCKMWAIGISVLVIVIIIIIVWNVSS
ncbi:vesicle-associated membrane protein 3 [Trichechus inunguis]